jgi:hypothetical protein
MATTYVSGLREVVRNLEKVGIEAADMKEVFTAIGQMVANQASLLAPRKSGRLAASIKPTKTKNKAAVRGGSARVPYAGAINYGWRKRGIAPSRFLQRAIDANESKAVQMMEDGLDQIITKHIGTD